MVMAAQGLGAMEALHDSSLVLFAFCRCNQVNDKAFCDIFRLP